MAKNDHMLAILWMLNSGAKITAKQISEKLEINIRTVYRYIDALCASGVPIVSDAGHHGGYSLLNHFIKSPLLFDIEEKKALLHAAAFAKEAGYPLSEALGSATSKLITYSNQDQENEINHQLTGFEVINRMRDPSVQLVLAELEQAVASTVSVEIDYHTGREEQAKKMMIDPYGIVFWNNKWCLLAFCHSSHDIRNFLVERILTVKPTQVTFIKPEDFSVRELFMQNLLPNLLDKEAWITLILEGHSEVLDDLCLNWYLGYHLKERTAHQAIFLIDEKSMHQYVPNFLLSYGKSIHIIEPQSLKERLIAVASDLIAYYQR